MHMHTYARMRICIGEQQEAIWQGQDAGVEATASTIPLSARASFDCFLCSRINRASRESAACAVIAVLSAWCLAPRFGRCSAWRPDSSSDDESPGSLSSSSSLLLEALLAPDTETAPSVLAFPRLSFPAGLPVERSRLEVRARSMSAG